MTIASVLVRLRRSFLICQPVIASAQAESVASLVGDVVSMTEYNCVSSANWWYHIQNIEMRLPTGVMKMENSIGPSTNPCDMPENNFTI